MVKACERKVNVVGNNLDDKILFSNWTDHPIAMQILVSQLFKLCVKLMIGLACMNCKFTSEKRNTVHSYKRHV